jgi:hypothetical protein
VEILGGLTSLFEYYAYAVYVFFGDGEEPGIHSNSPIVTNFAIS